MHLILVPPSEGSLRRAVGEAHRRYTRRVNFREGWRGHLWHGRFASFVMDDDHLLAAARYIELNPVRAKIVRKPHRYRYSSARAHLEDRDDHLLTATPLLELVPDWSRFITSAVDPEEHELLRRHERTGRPLGSKRFVTKLERLLGRPLHPRKGGRPPKKKN